MKPKLKYLKENNLTHRKIINKWFIVTDTGNLSDLNTVRNIENFNNSVIDNYVNVLSDCMDRFGVDLSNLPAWYKAIEEAEKLTKFKGE